MVLKVLDTTPGFGPPPAWLILSRSYAGFDTTRGTCGGSWGSWAGAASAPRAVPWSVTRTPSGIGSDTAGLPLKKSPCGRPDHRLRRRERTDAKAPCLPHLGSTRRDSRAAVPLPLGQSLRDRRSNVVEVLLQALSWERTVSAGRVVPSPPAAAHTRAIAGDLGRAAAAPESSRQGSHRGTSRAVGDRFSACLCSGTESRGIPVGVLEAP